jgi:membrane-bound lytic murein transglycosylase D
MRISLTRLGGLLCLLALAFTAQAEIAVDGDSSLKLAQSLPAPPQLAPGPPAAEAPLAPPPQVPLAPTVSREIRDDLPPLPTIDLTVQPDDLWQRLRNGFGMPDLQNPLVADRQAYYLNRPEMLKRILERSRRYMYYIVTELEKRGMPTELALLPMVESAFNPMAYSRARALGMWQFIPSTGKNYRLQQDGWVDRRRDIIASTSAALDYLQNIYEMNGDWHLALASYNWGEYAVARAVAKNQSKGLPTDYDSLKMPGETRYYVPKLQALKNIIAQPELFGIKLDPIPNRPYFGIVDINADLDVSTAAKLAEIPLDEFVALNPAYHRPVILGKDPNPLVLPTEKVAIFRANMERYEAEDKPLSNWSTYSLKKGERLDTVAAHHGISVARLKQLNGITARTKVGPGFALLVPRPGGQANPELLAAYLPKAPGEAPKGARGKHRRHATGKAKHKATGTAKPPAAKAKPVKKGKKR